MLWENQREAELEDYYRRKYADEAAASRHFGEAGEEMSAEIELQTLLPGVKYAFRNQVFLFFCRIMC